MSISVEVVKNLENNKVLIREKSGTQKKPVERYYAVPQENADKFVTQKKVLDKNRKFQKIMTGSLSAAIGLLVGLVVKFGAFGKTVAGLGTGLLALAGSTKADKIFDKKMQQNVMKNYNAEDVTGQMKPEDIK